MFLPRMRTITLALAAVLLVAGSARADYLKESVVLNFSDKAGSGNFGTVTVEAYDGNGLAGGGLSAGQVRLTFHRSGAPAGGDDLLNGFQNVGFNTDLSITKAQITGPTSNWKAVANPSLGGLGTFSWSVGTLKDFQNDASVLISGLNGNATPSHFVFDSTGSAPLGKSLFAGQWLELRLGDNGVGVTTESLASQRVNGQVPSAPEPTSLALGGLGLAGLLLMRRLRRQK